MNQLTLIQSKIYEIRGRRVMLDFDLAEMYQVETRVLNQAVKRNLERFPEDFMFKLSREEWEDISSQFVMTSRIKRPKTSVPYAFTEHGVVMLSGVLRSDIAVQVSISVARAFVALRQMLVMPQSDVPAQLRREIKKLRDEVEEMFADQNDINEETRAQLDAISMALAELQAKGTERPRRRIGFVIPEDEQ